MLGKFGVPQSQLEPLSFPALWQQYLRVSLDFDTDLSGDLVERSADVWTAVLQLGPSL